jgi:hypothetical protein
MQVQKMLKLDKDPTEWGWIRSQRGLSPLKTMKDPAPASILKLISCGCKKGCGNACGCRKAGLKCSILCGFCIGQSCENVPDITVESDNDDDFERSNDDRSDDEVNNSKDTPGPSKRQKL